MADNTKEKLCPGCMTRQKLVKKQNKWTWKKHYLETSDIKLKCPYSETSRSAD